MKRLALVLFLVALAAPVAFAQTTLTATLSGANEVPPADPDGTGSATITFSGTTLTYTITANNIDAPTAQHIHTGAAGVNGPIVVNLPGVWVGAGQGPWTLAGTTTTTLAIANAIQSNPAGHYVNVHNTPFPGGAIRGQLALSGTAVPSASTWGLFALAAMLAVAGLLIVRRL